MEGFARGGTGEYHSKLGSRVVTNAVESREAVSDAKVENTRSNRPSKSPRKGSGIEESVSAASRMMLT